MDGRAIALNHVYARMVHDLSEQKNDKVKLTFTEVPIAEEILETSGMSALLRSWQQVCCRVRTRRTGGYRGDHLGNWEAF